VHNLHYGDQVCGGVGGFGCMRCVGDGGYVWDVSCIVSCLVYHVVCCCMVCLTHLCVLFVTSNLCVAFI
jgi:hypothetical protein